MFVAKKISLTNALINLGILVLIVFWVVIPLMYGFGMAFMPKEELYKVPPNIIPRNPTLANFKTVMESLNIPLLYLNTIISATIAVVCTLFFSTLAGYSFAKLRFFAKNELFTLCILKLMIPEAALVIPWFYIVGNLGLIDSIYAIPLPSLIGAWSIFLMRQYIYSVPTDLIDAARIDGSSEIGIFFRIILPVIKPAIGAAIIINFMYAWNWFLWPIVVLQSNDNFTLNLGLHFIRWLEMGGGESPTDYGALMAISFIYTVPFVIFYLIFQRFFVESITISGMKE